MSVGFLFSINNQNIKISPPPRGGADVKAAGFHIGGGDGAIFYERIHTKHSHHHRRSNCRR